MCHSQTKNTKYFYNATSIETTSQKSKFTTLKRKVALNVRFVN